MCVRMFFVRKCIENCQPLFAGGMGMVLMFCVFVLPDNFTYHPSNPGNQDHYILKGFAPAAGPFLLADWLLACGLAGWWLDSDFLLISREKL